MVMENCGAACLNANEGTPLKPTAAAVSAKDLVKVRLFIVLLDRRRLSILTPNTSQLVAYLTYSRVRLNTREYVRQKIFIRLRRLFQSVQRIPCGLGIASRAQRSYASHLRLLQCRIDPQHVDGRFFFNLKTINTNHYLFLRLNCFLITIRGFLYLALHVSGFNCTQHPT